MKATTYSLNNEISQIEVDAGLLSETYEVSTENGSKVELPESFSSDIREDMVKDAVHSSRANRRQPYGHRTHDGKKAPQAGMKHSVEWWGKGRGVSRIMRKTGQRTAAQNPHTRGGRRAHGPLVEKDWSMKFNTKQKRIARDSAIAATCNAEIVASRGHRFDESLRFPIIIDKYTEVKDGQSDAHDPESIPLAHPYAVIQMPWITEKTLEARRIADGDDRRQQNNNRLEFIVRRESTKPQIKEAVETLLDVKVSKVNTRITRTGKHASVRLADGYDAEEAALKLGAF